ncbi:acetylxylan esterase, partial [bacterium]|nr:acetylxylan esterase [bacterium]
MNRIVFISFLLMSNALMSYCEPLPIETSPIFDQSNNIRQYLMRAASEITHHSLDGIHALDDWKAVRSQRYHDLLEMLSLVDVPIEDERPPLNVTETGVIQRDGYKIIKLYYESLPHLYVPANLYVPDSINGKAPAILYPCGHSRTQKVHYQPHPAKFAQLGFVALVFETVQWGEVYGSHWGEYSEGQFQWYSRGYTPGGVECWNGIRGIDLLCSLDYVDADNIGVTGISGGGSQSWY